MFVLFDVSINFISKKRTCLELRFQSVCWRNLRVLLYEASFQTEFIFFISVVRDIRVYGSAAERLVIYLQFTEYKYSSMSTHSSSTTTHSTTSWCIVAYFTFIVNCYFPLFSFNPLKLLLCLLNWPL